MKKKKTFKELRKEKNLTQCQLAKKVNVTQGTVAMWETGKATPKTENLIILSKILDCSIENVLQSI